MIELHCEEAKLSQRHLNNEKRKLSEVLFYIFFLIIKNDF